MTESQDGLGPEVERLRRALAAVTAKVTEHDELIGVQAESIQDLTGPRGTPPAVTSWIDMQPDEQDEARAQLNDLAAWVGRVYLRYSGAELPSCWMWHPDVVEELWWLYCCHTVAYRSRGGSWAKVATWHHTERPGVVARIRPAVGTCELSRHTDTAFDRVDTGPREAPLRRHLDLVAATWVERREPPAPDGEALEDALSYAARQPAWA